MDATSRRGGLAGAEDTAPTRILIADDEPAIRQALHLILEEEGYPAVEAADGVEALAVLLGSPCPLVVLLDLRMPGLSGLEVLLRVSADPELMARHAIAVLSATSLTGGKSDPQLATLLTQHGIPVLAKPFDLDELLALVARLWERVRPA